MVIFCSPEILIRPLKYFAHAMTQRVYPLGEALISALLSVTVHIINFFFPEKLPAKKKPLARKTRSISYDSDR